MEIGFLDTLAVVALRVGQAVESLFEVRTGIRQPLKLWNRVGRGRADSSSFQKAKAMF